MLEDLVKSSLLINEMIATDSEVEVEPLPADGFKAREVRADQTVGKRFIGYRRSEVSGIFLREEAKITPEQQPIYDRIAAEVSACIASAEQEGCSIFPLMKLGDHPELFDPTLSHHGIAANTREGMVQVWHGIDNLLTVQGYEEFLSYGADTPTSEWEIRVRPRGERRFSSG